VTRGQYWLGFALTLGAAALYGLVLPLVELAYRRAAGGGRAVTYALVIEMQLVMGFFATAFCTMGMIVNKDFQVRSPRVTPAPPICPLLLREILTWTTARSASSSKSQRNGNHKQPNHGDVPGVHLQ
jgi:hypothetical protein